VAQTVAAARHRIVYDAEEVALLGRNEPALLCI
jgi:hypothetical protein